MTMYDGLLASIWFRAKNYNSGFVQEFSDFTQE